MPSLWRKGNFPQPIPFSFLSWKMQTDTEQSCPRRLPSLHPSPDQTHSTCQLSPRVRFSMTDVAFQGASVIFHVAASMSSNPVQHMLYKWSKYENSNREVQKITWRIFMSLDVVLQTSINYSWSLLTQQSCFGQLRQLQTRGGQDWKNRTYKKRFITSKRHHNPPLGKIFSCIYMSKTYCKTRFHLC